MKKLLLLTAQFTILWTDCSTNTDGEIYKVIQVSEVATVTVATSD